MAWYHLVFPTLAGVFMVLGQKKSDSDPEVVQHSVVLRGTLDDVFRHLTDIAHYAQWFPAVAEYVRKDDGEFAVGKTFSQFVYVPLLGDVKRSLLVVGYDPPLYLSYLEDSWTLPKIEVFTETIDDNRTKLTWRMTTRWRSYLFQYTILPLMKFVHETISRQAMLNLLQAFKPA